MKALSVVRFGMWKNSEYVFFNYIHHPVCQIRSAFIASNYERGWLFG